MQMEKGSCPRTNGKNGAIPLPPEQTRNIIFYLLCLHSRVIDSMSVVVHHIRPFKPLKKRTHHIITSHYHLPTDESCLFSLGFFFLHFHCSAWRRSVIDGGSDEQET